MHADERLARRGSHPARAVRAGRTGGRDMTNVALADRSRRLHQFKTTTRFRRIG